MTPQEWEVRFNDLVEKVRKMRGHQKEYFKYRAKTDLEKSKFWERQVDQTIDGHVKEQKSQQQELFKS